MKNLLFIILIASSLSTAANTPSLSAVSKFASVEKSRELLLTEDLFTNSWSQFDIDSRLQKKNSTKEQLFAYISEQALEWTQEEKAKLSTILSQIDESIVKQGFNINLPSEIYFVKTTAKEEGGASGYTRANYIVLKSDLLSQPENALKQTIIHEVFHVLSRNDAAFRRDMYKIIGFEIMNPIDYPAAISAYRITNPDAPQTDSFLTVKKDGKSIDCMMILYSDRPYDGGLFFNYLNVGFMELTGGKGNREPLLRNGRPVIYSMNEINGFFEQIGRNTQYILHPEEIMADNFVFAINDRKGQPAQHIVESIQKRLKKR